jgi:hypothetical protein
VRSPGSDDDIAARQLADIKGSAEISPDEVLELKQDLAGAQATIAGLTADLTAPDRNRSGLEGRLLVAEARVAELESRLAVLVAGLVPLPPPQAPREP